MSSCEKCGASLDGIQVTSRVSKKNGKPWSAVICKECGNFHWVNNSGSKKNDQPKVLSADNKRIIELLEIIARNTQPNTIAVSTKSIPKSKLGPDIDVECVGDWGEEEQI